MKEIWKDIWKDIPDYEGLYIISNLGRIKSLCRATTSGKILKSSNNSEYPTVALCKNGKLKTYVVHRLVLQAFLGKSDLDANHIDGKKSNNRLDNLEYCTRSENLKHAYRTGLKSNKGEKHPGAKLNEWDVKIIRKLYKNSNYWHSLRKLAKLLKVTPSAIWRVVTNKTWKHIQI